MKCFFVLAVLCLFAVPAFAQDLHGEIRGVVMNAADQPQPAQRIELRRIDGRSERFVKTTDLNGEFVYTGLSAGRYVVEVRREGRVVATSEPLVLTNNILVVSDVVVAPRVLSAQMSEAVFPELRHHLRAGDRLFVASLDGVETEGRFVRVSPNSLVVAIDGGHREFLPTEVGSIARHGDSIVNGAGFGAVFMGLLAASSAGASCSPECAGTMIRGALLGAAIGASFGALFDAFHRGRTVVYRVTSPSVTSAGRHHGVLLSPRWAR